MANEIINQNTGEVATQYKSFSNFMDKVGKKLVENTLNDDRRRTQFIANIITAVSSNPNLQKCDFSTLVSAGLQAEVLHFPINNSFGYAYLVPYEEKKWNPQTRQREVVRVCAQFQIGYKGYIQLAIRSGQYRNINVVEVREGELSNTDYSPLTGSFSFNWITDYNVRKTKKVIGYAGFFELNNGFTKTIYITKEEMLEHADTYSKAFNAKDYQDYITGNYDKRNESHYSSFWYKDFDAMALKTVIRQLLSKWGIMSVEMQEAYVKDQAVMRADGTYDYIDAKDFVVNDENRHATIDEVKADQKATNGSKELPEEMKVGQKKVEQAPTQSDDDWLNAYINPNEKI